MPGKQVPRQFGRHPMSRSYRHIPICSVTMSGFNRGEKYYKRKATRRMRRVNRLRALREMDLLSQKEVDANYWVKDGKMMFNPYKNPHLMRK